MSISKILNPEQIQSHLLQVALNDSHEDFRILYDYYYPRLFAQAYSFFNDSETAREVIVDLFVGLWQSRKILNKVQNPDAYFFIALKHARAKYIEKNITKNQNLLIDQIPDSITTVSSDSLLIEKELDEKFQHAFAKLPPRCAEVFRLVRQEKKKYSDVAEIMGISIKTVDSQMNKAVKILYEELKEYLFCVLV